MSWPDVLALKGIDLSLLLVVDMIKTGCGRKALLFLYEIEIPDHGELYEEKLILDKL